MKGLSVTVIDVLGIFVPGVLLLAGVVLIPPVGGELRDILLNAPEVGGGSILASKSVVTAMALIGGYTAGFLIRLVSVQLMQWLTHRWWAEKVKEQVRDMEVVFAGKLADDRLAEALTNSSKGRGESEVTGCTPYFSFAKRIVRYAAPTLRADIDRLEAEVRFAAGLVIPMLLLAFVGGWRFYGGEDWVGGSMALLCTLGSIVLFVTFPARRVREVVYVYYLALIVMKFQQLANGAAASERTEVVDGPSAVPPFPSTLHRAKSHV